MLYCSRLIFQNAFGVKYIEKHIYFYLELSFGIYYTIQETLKISGNVRTWNKL